MTIDGEATIDLNASTAVLVSNDLKLNSDAAVLGLGADNDVTLTHVADTGILLNSTRQLQFGDSGTHISQSADGVLDLVADTEIEINATTIDINGNVEVSGTLQVATITATTAFVPDASNGAALGTSSLEFSDLFLADGGEILFGVDQDVILRHDHNSGLIIDRANTSDNSPTSLTLQTAETDIAADDVIGVINFQAPDEGTGTDAILVAAGIAAVSEGDFAADNNATKLSFRTAASAAAAETMSLSSAGNLTVSGDASIGDDLTLASDASVLKFGADGDINITHVHNTGLTSNGTLDVAGDITGSTLNADGDTAAGDAAAMGYTAAEGLILTGQGSTNDVTIKNDADADVIEIPTGTVNVNIAGATTTAALTASGILKTDDATDATSTTDGSLQTDGGLSVAKDAVIGDDLLLLSDSTVIKFGADSDITLTHAADTGLTANGSLTATTLEATADTAAGDNAAIGFTSAEGLILTGQGSTNDVTIKMMLMLMLQLFLLVQLTLVLIQDLDLLVSQFTAKAWVNFNGTGTVAIRDSGNVSSITDHGTGLFTANFATNMPDVNYCVSLTTSVQASTTTNGGFITALSRTTTPAVGSVRFETINSSFAFATR